MAGAGDLGLRDQDLRHLDQARCEVSCAAVVIVATIQSCAINSKARVHATLVYLTHGGIDLLVV